MRYDTFVRVLDNIRKEAPNKYTRYSSDPWDLEKTNQARSRAFIHLYLKVMFGVTDFSTREHTITDAGNDGGIDGYYIDKDSRTIHLLQSKFRTNEKNFEEKNIALGELLAMDIERILGGETSDEGGQAYNGKILQLQREISQLQDVARYSYRVVILANLKGVPPAKLRQLTGGYAADVFDFEKTYRKLVFPVITGNYFAASDITIPIDLSNKNAGSKISYQVKTKFSNCEITVLFVPTIEIAKLMHKYKNTILKYNPRSYLDLEGQAVNAAIRSTILGTATNEFALFNNGLTMLSEETNINEKIGQKNKAQLRIKNPQIINGGQTSFTLSRIYSENEEKAEEVFSDKEVLLKVITVLDNTSDAAKLELIDEISNATNKQTPVITADKFANEALHMQIQQEVFERYGLLYERKRGEFSDGVKDGYISAADVIERNHFWRLCYTANGKVNRGFQKKLFQRNEFSDIDLTEEQTYERLFLAVHVFRRIKQGLNPNARIEKDVYGKVFAYIQLFLSRGLDTGDDVMTSNMIVLEQEWASFIEKQRAAPSRGRHAFFDKATGEARLVFSETKYYRSYVFEKDVIAHFQNIAPFGAQAAAVA